jgi:transposase
MYIKKTTKRYKGKTYKNYLLVEAIATPKGPRHKVICSLGDLSPRPGEDWLRLARKVEAALVGQMSFDQPDPEVDSIVAKVRRSKRAQHLEPTPTGSDDIVAVHTDRVSTQTHRAAGAVHVGHQMWKRLGLDEILEGVGLSPNARLLTEIMTLNRLVFPTSEYAMADWVRRTALPDILMADLSKLNEDPLYANLDRLYPNREKIESALCERERQLFKLDESYYLYDLTSTYFEGQALGNSKAKRGYSRDKRPDCKQVTIGLVLDADGFPKAHEVFDGNRQDRTTVDEMLETLERRSGRRGGSTVIVDRGMAFDENIQQIKARGHHYIVASRQPERTQWLAEFESEEGWEEVLRIPSPRNPAQKKSRVWIKRETNGDEIHILCRGEGRVNKDRAIREKHEQRLVSDLRKLQARIDGGRLKKPEKIHVAIGRLKERHSRVARYYQISYDPSNNKLSYEEDSDKKDKARKLDGGYILKTDRTDLTGDQIWRLYILLTRVEDAFRDMKTPLTTRPIFHQIECRVDTHIFLCVLAYHLLVCVEKAFLDHGIHTSWATLRQQLETHQVCTVVLPASDGRVLTIRKGATPEPEHREIYKVLDIPQEVMKPVKLWTEGPGIGTEEIRK